MLHLNPDCYVVIQWRHSLQNAYLSTFIDEAEHEECQAQVVEIGEIEINPVAGEGQPMGFVDLLFWGDAHRSQLVRVQFNDHEHMRDEITRVVEMKAQQDAKGQSDDLNNGRPVVILNTRPSFDEDDAVEPSVPPGETAH